MPFDLLTAVANLAAILVGFLGSYLTLLLGRRSGRAPEESAPTIADRVNSLRSALADSARLIEEINAEFELQTAAAERIRAEAEENQRLAALHRDEAEAVRNLVASTIEGAQARASRIGGRQQWLFFLAGLFFAIPLGVAGNFAFELVKAWIQN